MLPPFPNRVRHALLPSFAPFAFLLHLSVVCIFLFIGCASDSDPEVDTSGEITVVVRQTPFPNDTIIEVKIVVAGRTASATMNDVSSTTLVVTEIPVGTQTYIITWRSLTHDVVLGVLSDTMTVQANTTTEVSPNQSLIDTAFDDDGDGFTNLIEVQSGSDPLDPTDTPPVGTHTLTISLSGSGSGSVGSSPSGINCGTDCSQQYDNGTIVTLTATASNGSDFTGWSGACSGAGSCTVTMDQDHTVTAFFTALPGTLTVQGGGNGSGTVISGDGQINCSISAGTASGACSEIYDFGAEVALMAGEAGGSDFTGWSGACSGAGSCTVTMNQPRMVTASFTLEPRTLAVQGGGNGSGTVISGDGQINCSISGTSEGGTCSASYTFGTQVILTADEAASSDFTGWSGGCSGTGDCMVTMTEDLTVTATFTLGPTLAVEGGGTGSGTVTSGDGQIDCSISGTSEGGTCSASYTFGTQVTLTADEAAGSDFTGWSGGGCSGTAQCVVIMDQGRTISATFDIMSSIEVSPPSLDFGEVEVGTMLELIVTVSNVGNNDLTIIAIFIESSPTSSYFLTEVPAIPIILSPSDSAFIGVAFSPTLSTPATQTAVLRIDSNDPDEPEISVEIVGTAVE